MLGLALLAPTTSATAVGETCRGEAATIVGSGPTLIGTEGRDVIVTGTATEVSALGGDDLVCVTGTAGTYVAAGTGNDTVDTTALGGASHVTVYLGAGADTLVGGAAAETVTTGDPHQGSDVDNDTDSVSTGAGDDRVVVGTQYLPNTELRSDAVELGPGDDVATIQSRTMLAAATIDGGEGTDQIAVDFTNDGVSSVDMERGIVQAGDGTYAKPVSLISFETADISTTWPGGSGAWGPATVSYKGTSGDDVVTLRPDQTASNPDVTVQTFGGDDQVLFADTPTSDTRVDTGAGDDLLVAAGPNGGMRLDLATGVWRSERFFGPDPAYWGPTPDVVTSAVDNVENAFLMAPEVKILGNGKANELSYNGCRGTLRGGAGGDRLSIVAGDPWWDQFSYDCEALSLEATSTMAGGPGQDRLRGGPGKDKLRGDAGNDALHGRAGDDVLLGGRGTDQADGGKGRDRCVAERARRCER
ncbi:MAG: outer rane adhesin like protein [Nocardioides sp.]|nr:outer rane adhesin like protein [Nocardioides sp.]